MPLEVSSTEFDSLAAKGGQMIYVFASGRLLASKRHAQQVHISHAALAAGGPVEAAGEFKASVDGPTKLVTELNNMSGHYRPDTKSLHRALEAFEARGWHVCEKASESTI